jgi:menaquinone-dependent protoporphyrinogen IX oxidase
MTKVIILYAPHDSGIKKFIEALLKAFDKKRFTVTAKNALKSHIPDIAAADAVVFGSKGNSAVSIHAEFKELLRAFSGVNLAGKSAGFFLEKNTDTFKDFEKALKVSDISIFDEPLIYQEKGIDAKQLRRWADKFGKFLEKNIHE